MKYSRLAFSLAVVLLIAGSAVAQERKQLPRNEQSQYIVSAKSGVVNLVDGDVNVRRLKPFALPEMLIAGDALQTGDTVRTGAAGRTEVLLSPGCFLRLGESSEFVFLFDERADQDQIKLLKGSMIIEASVSDLPIFVAAPGGDFAINRSGLYRFNVAANGETQVAVRKGRLLANKTTIKEGKLGTLNGGSPEIAAFNKKETDPLEDWSRERARTLIAANKQLSTRAMKNSLAQELIQNVWIYDSFYGRYTFLPVTGGFSSPYGWGYSVCNPYWYAAPWSPYNGSWPRGGGNAGGQPGSGGGSSSGGSVGSGGSAGSGGGHPGSVGSPRADPPVRGGGPEREPARGGRRW
ncbi:MAG TPA: FecR family protein [Blastocatellia bacterium]|nr:FecR family protein [Blastocatellia bacterium]